MFYKKWNENEIQKRYARKCGQYSTQVFYAYYRKQLCLFYNAHEFIWTILTDMCVCQHSISHHSRLRRRGYQEEGEAHDGHDRAQGAVVRDDAW